MEGERESVLGPQKRAVFKKAPHPSNPPMRRRANAARREREPKAETTSRRDAAEAEGPLTTESRVGVDFGAPLHRRPD